MQEIAPDVYVYQGYPHVTVGAVRTSEGWVLVDAPTFPADAQHWLETLQNIDSLPLRCLILTDSNRDRVLNAGRYKVPVISHDRTAEHLRESSSMILAQAAEELSTNEKHYHQISGIKLAIPQVTFGEAMSLYIGEHEFQLMARPGAAVGSMWVALPADNVIFVGDSVVETVHPFIADGVTKLWLESLRQLRSDRYEGWQIISGRDFLITPDGTEAMSDYLRAARRRVYSVLRGEKPRGHLAEAVPDLLDRFEVVNHQQETIQKRILHGLDVIYDELQLASEDADEDEDSDEAADE